MFIEAGRGNVRFNGELMDARTELNDAQSFLSTNHVDTLEPLQANVTWNFSDLLRPGYTGSLKVGRYTIDVGRRRFVSRSTTRNTITSYYGRRMAVARVGWTQRAGLLGRADADAADGQSVAARERPCARSRQPRHDVARRVLPVPRVEESRPFGGVLVRPRSDQPPEQRRAAAPLRLARLSRVSTEHRGQVELRGRGGDAARYVERHGGRRHASRPRARRRVLPLGVWLHVREQAGAPGAAAIRPRERRSRSVRRPQRRRSTRCSASDGSTSCRKASTR